MRFGLPTITERSVDLAFTSPVARFPYLDIVLDGTVDACACTALGGNLGRAARGTRVEFCIPNNIHVLERREESLETLLILFIVCCDNEGSFGPLPSVDEL